MDRWLDLSSRIVIRQYGLDQSESLLLRGLIDIRNGDIDAAESRLNQWSHIHQKNAYIEIMLQYHHDLLEIEVLLARGKINEAIRIGRKLEPPPLPRTYVSLMTDHIIPVPKDGLARAYYASGDMNQAIAEYQRLVTFDPKDPSKFLIDPRNYYKLGKLYEETGKIQPAIMKYERFLDLWKNADENLDEVVDARERLAKLKDIQ